MTADRLLEELGRRGVELWIEEGRLRYRATQDPLTPELLAAMREGREALLARLRAVPSAGPAAIDDGASAAPPAPAGDGAAFPLSAGQQGIWFLCQAAPDSPAYNIAVAVRILSPLDREALRAALLALLRRHPSLRTVFERAGDQPVQRVRPEPGLVLEVRDAAGWTEAEVSAALHGESQRPFDLERGPLLRGLLLATARDHVLLLTLHHLVHDGWSLWILLDELRELYAAAVEGRPPALPGPGAGYRQFVAAEAAAAAGPAAARARAFWQEHLAGPLPILDLPGDRPRPPARSDRGGSAPFVLDAGLTARLRALAAAEGVTLHVLLLSAYVVLLHRLGGQDDLLVGTPVWGRDEVAFRDLVGYCLNQVAIRADLHGDPPFGALLAQVRQRTLEALEHQAYPFTRLVEDLRPARDPGRTPVFQATFALQRPHRFAEVADLFVATEMGTEVEPGRRIEWGRLTLAPFVLAHRRAWFDLTLQMMEVRDLLAGSLTYSADLFDDATARRITGHLLALLRAVVEDPGQAVSRLTLLSPAEASRLAGESPGAPAPVAAPRTLHEGFRAQARRRPDAVALVGEDGVVTYGALDARAARLARALRARGVGPETIVGVAAGRSTPLLLAILAVLQAGGAYLPLDPDYPDERLRFMLADAGAALVLAEPALASRLAPAGVPVLDLAPGGAPPAPPTPEARPAMAGPATSPGPDGLAYVIYTSGSTGRPKGVLVTHANVARLFGAAGPWLAPAPTDVWSVAHSAAFDFSVWEMWGAWLHGGRVVVASRDTARSPEEMLRRLTEEGVTILSQTPGAFHALAEVALRAPGWTPGPLRLVVFGGDALEPARLQPWVARHGDAGPLLVNMYGITETTVHVTERPLARADLDRPGSRIGRPLRDLRAPVLDRHLVPVPDGVAGELCVGGAGVARGYLGRPALTADRFRPDPYAARPGARLYRSGDLARRRGPGPPVDLEYLGRLDQQVKIRGFRIEPGEVEAALLGHPGVAAAAVVARRAGSGPARLVAHVVPDAVRAGPVLRALRLQQEGRVPGRGLVDLPGGLAVAHLNAAETAYVHGEIFERDAYLRHGVEVRDGDVVLDVGASIGLFPLALHRRGLRTRVLAFEPLPDAAACLRANAELHGLDVTVVPCALGEADGVTGFTYYPEASVLSGRFADPAAEARLVRTALFPEAAGRAGGGADGAGVGDLLADRLRSRALTVPLRRLSGVLAEHGIGRVGLLKIDAEKGELEVLRGLDPADFARIDQVVVEVHDVAGRRAAVEALLREHGYRVVTDQDETLAGTEVVTVFATRRPGVARVPGPGAPADLPWGSSAALLDDLRRHLRARLPEHMVPAALALLPALPLTANGKVDRRALPDPESPGAGEGGAFVAPRTATERALADVWAAVLRLPRVSVTDNFFELGGDSILSIAVATRAQDAGLRVVSRQVFQHQTVADLAAALDATPGRPHAPSPPRAGEAAGGSPGVGPAALGPIQRWFLDLGLAEPHHFNQAARLELPAGATPDAVRRALRSMVAEHEALRLYLRPGPGGPVPMLAGAVLDPPLAVVDASDGGDQASRAVARVADDLQASLDLGAPPLLRAALVLPAAGAPSLVLVAHHLLVDAVSWRILADDLRAALDPAGPAPRRASSPASFQAWVEGLTALARSGSWDADLGHWLGLGRSPARPLPLDGADDDPTARSHGEAAWLTASLPAAETRALLQDLVAARRLQAHEPLLAALLLACRQWTGEDRLLVDLEGHGRDDVVEGLDLSRTVGWFTALYPVLLIVEDGASPAEALRAVGAGIRQVPHRGLSHGVLLHLRGDPAMAAALRAIPTPEVAFNYLGRLDHDLASLAGDGLGRPFGLRNRRPHLLDVDAFVAEDRLHVRWTYARRLHRRETIARLADDHLATLRELALLGRPGGSGPRAGAGRGSLDPSGLRRLARALDRKDPR